MALRDVLKTNVNALSNGKGMFERPVLSYLEFMHETLLSMVCTMTRHEKSSNSFLVCNGNIFFVLTMADYKGAQKIIYSLQLLYHCITNGPPIHITNLDC
jgi:hypothetical protein